MESHRDFSERPWIIVGAGRLGGTLVLLAESLHLHVAATWNRSERGGERTEALVADSTICVSGGNPRDSLGRVESPRVVWITVVDDAISATARRLAPALTPEDIVLHCSGVAGSRILSEAGVRSAAVGSVHVLRAISNPREAVGQLGGMTWSVEGEPEAVLFARWLVSRLGAQLVVLSEEQKRLYHAAAVMAANLLVGLMDASMEVAESAGISRRYAREMLLPLAQSSLANLVKQPASEALTGPVARGDSHTIEVHREALARIEGEELGEIYDVLTRRAKLLRPDVWSEDD